MEISIIHNSEQLRPEDIPILEKLIADAEKEIPKLAKRAESNPEIAEELRKKRILLGANYRLKTAIERVKGVASA